MSEKQMDASFDLAREISPRRKTTAATTLKELVAEQLAHFGIDAKTPFGQRLESLTIHLYRAQADTKRLWEQVVAELATWRVPDLTLRDE
jgi:hypothetical protein